MNANESGRFMMVSRMKPIPTTFNWIPFSIHDGKGLELT